MSILLPRWAPPHVAVRKKGFRFLIMMMVDGDGFDVFFFFHVLHFMLRPAVHGGDMRTRRLPCPG